MRLILLILFGCLLNSAFSQVDTIAPHVEIVGKYDENAYTVIYPLGYSKEGHFAYIYQDMNVMGGAEIYDFNFIIHKNRNGVPEFSMGTTYNFEEDTISYNEQEIPNEAEDSLFWGYSFFKHKYWAQNKDTIIKLMDLYGIKRDLKQAVKPIEISSNFGFKITVEKDTSKERGIRMDELINIYIRFTGKSKRAIYSKTNALNADGWAMDTFGNYTDYLFYEIHGFIKSPLGNHYWLYLIEYSMGYEEPAENVILIPFEKRN
ncbi:hypothetical protein K6119_10165 [Paracrocinitomix mangrovi]|uniref:hypothetical protein n=1 Tax=Paracrocinitomix mangrovi TaxID=2862509 RepID=UPI001C8D81B8|nr:hypothetical protein [Paracrocinitomix mangrovi]UKN00097.1 hypothetical protein K6119_10165 [Paracrocinitomix mangrovi]